MEIFKLDKAPYFFGLLITVIGWHISQLVNEITRTQAVSYSISVDRNTRDVAVRVSNVSRTKSLVNASFSLSCEGGENCLTPLQPAEEGAEAVYGEVRPIAPHFVFSEQRRNSASAVTFAPTVAAGGRYDIVARLVSPDSRIQFYFIPDRDRPLDIYLYDQHSMIGFLVQNYLFILVASFLGFLAVLVFWVFAAVKFGAPAPAPAPASAPATAPPPARASRRSRQEGKDK